MDSSKKVTLIGDIGGTNAHFASVDENGDIVARQKYIVSVNTSFVETALQFQREHAADIGTVVIAAAGPVGDVGGVLNINLSNAGWRCNQGEIADAFSLPLSSVDIINDFAAAAYATAALKADKLVTIQEGNPSNLFPRYIVGPGTGLGVGRLTPNGNGGFSAWAAEGGHTATQIVTAHQQHIVDVLRSLYPEKKVIIDENLYCFGQGLPNLELANRVIGGESVSLADKKSSIEIANGARNQVASCIGAINDFSFGLGVKTGNEAINPISYGGIYVLGAFEKLQDLFNRDLFLDGTKHNNQSHLVAQMPMYHVVGDTPAFDGIVYYLKQRQLIKGPAL